jgi:hypothetical protein
MVGMFSSLSKVYTDSSTNAFEYAKNSFILFTPFLYLVAITYSFILFPISIVFSFLTLLDDYTRAVESLRRAIINSMSRLSYGIQNNLFSFLFKPLIFILHIPFFFISLMIPRVSGFDIASSVVTADIPTPTQTPLGAIKKLVKTVWRANSSLYGYDFRGSFILIRPITMILTLLYSIIFIIIALLITMLIPLDWISKLIDGIRFGVVRYADSNKDKIKNGLFSFLFIPALLITLAPLFALVIVIPKISSSFNGDSA